MSDGFRPGSGWSCPQFIRREIGASWDRTQNQPGDPFCRLRRVPAGEGYFHFIAGGNIFDKFAQEIGNFFRPGGVLLQHLRGARLLEGTGIVKLMIVRRRGKGNEQRRQPDGRKFRQ